MLIWCPSSYLWSSGFGSLIPWLWGLGADRQLLAGHHCLGTTENLLKYTPELLEKEANLLVLEL